jgi:hypothetical protein
MYVMRPGARSNSWRIAPSNAASMPDLGVRVAVAPPLRAERHLARPAGAALRLAIGAAGLLLLWTLSYLARQNEVALPPSFVGDFFLEGALLALAWLAAIAGGCIAMLAGCVTH